MIQFKRGKTESWRRAKTILAPGQPGYDREKHKIKIGDGESSWDELPDVSGLRLDEILDSEENAKEKVKAVESLGILGKLLTKLTNAARPVFTYGAETPDENTKGRVYLQYFDTDPEVDYVVDTGVNGDWTYRKWNSGRAECWCTTKLKTSVTNTFEGASLFYDNKTMSQISYPFTFSKIPSETATVQSPGGLAWLANRKANTVSKSGAYSIISLDSQADASYTVSVQVKGSWK